MSQHITVLGAGVIGLSIATRLQEAGYSVTIVARDFPGPFETIDAASQINYTSPWGGAHNRWVPPATAEEEQREHAFSVTTFRRMKELVASNPEAGITFMKGIEYLEAPGPEYSALTEARAEQLGIEEFRLLAQGELPEGVRWGCEYHTWCVNPMVYCSFLLRRVVFGGGRIVKREVRDLQEVFATSTTAAEIVINASGNGFADENMFITRGQTCLVANPCEATVTRQNADGSWTFCVPRNFEGGTVIGGTKEPDNWDPSPSLVVREELLSKFSATYPRILGPSQKFEVLRDIVGRRPTRHGGLRLETETAGAGKHIVHAYGLGGRGYELSWGVAEAVLHQVKGL